MRPVSSSEGIQDKYVAESRKLLRKFLVSLFFSLVEPEILEHDDLLIREGIDCRNMRIGNQCDLLVHQESQPVADRFHRVFGLVFSVRTAEVARKDYL